MIGRGGGGFAANASDHTPYVFHWSLTVEFGYVRPPAILLAQVDCSSSFCTEHAKVREICSVHFACKRLQSFLRSETAVSIVDKAGCVAGSRGSAQGFIGTCFGSQNITEEQTSIDIRDKPGCVAGGLWSAQGFIGTCFGFKNITGEKTTAEVGSGSHVKRLLLPYSIFNSTLIGYRLNNNEVDKSTGKLSKLCTWTKYIPEYE